MATDDFNRSNASTLGANWSIGSTDAGNDQNSFKVASNRAVGVGVSGNYYSGGGAVADDQYSQATLILLAETWTSLRVRRSTSAVTNYNGGSYKVVTGHDRPVVWKTIAGVRTVIGSAGASALVANDVVRLEVTGSTTPAIKINVNGVEVVSVTDSTGTTIASGYPGIGGRTSSADRPIWDDWSGGALSSTVDVTLSGIQSAEAFGTTAASLASGLAGISTAEAIGAPVASLTTGTAGIGTDEGVGTPGSQLGAGLSGIDSAEAFGAATDALTSALSGIESAEAFGVIGAVDVTLEGIPSAEAFGTITSTLVDPSRTVSGAFKGYRPQPWPQVILPEPKKPKKQKVEKPKKPEPPPVVSISLSGFAGSPQFGAVSESFAVFLDGIQSSEGFGVLQTGVRSVARSVRSRDRRKEEELLMLL